MTQPPSGSPPNPFDAEYAKFQRGLDEAQQAAATGDTSKMTALNEALAQPGEIQIFPCPECRNPDGSLNTDWAHDTLYEMGSMCCGGYVDDFGFCPRCKEHAENLAICETCGEAWGDDFGSGQIVRRPDYDEKPSNGKATDR